MLTIKQVRLREVLYNTAPKSGATPDYCHGLIVGVVAALMAETGKLYETVIREVAENLPVEYRLDCIPQVFQDDILKNGPPVILKG
jgi:hypothetical protein